MSHQLTKFEFFIHLNCKYDSKLLSRRTVSKSQILYCLNYLIESNLKLIKLLIFSFEFSLNQI